MTNRVVHTSATPGLDNETVSESPTHFYTLLLRGDAGERILYGFTTENVITQYAPAWAEAIAQNRSEIEGYSEVVIRPICREEIDRQLGIGKPINLWER